MIFDKGLFGTYVQDERFYPISKGSELKINVYVFVGANDGFR